MKIYAASSWRNALQPAIVQTLRRLGHDVYDFKQPDPSNPSERGFSWADIDPNWKQWSPDEYKAALQHPIAKRGYAFDIKALRDCDVVVFVLPCGKSASWEFGYAMGQGKKGYVVQLEPQEPELMFQEATIITSMGQLFEIFADSSALLTAEPNVAQAFVTDVVRTLVSAADLDFQQSCMICNVKLEAYGRVPSQWVCPDHREYFRMSAVDSCEVRLADKAETPASPKPLAAELHASANALCQVGQKIRYRDTHGSTGVIVSVRADGPFVNRPTYYVRYIYGKDSRGEQVTATGALQRHDFDLISEEDYEKVFNRRFNEPREEPKETGDGRKHGIPGEVSEG